MFSSTSGSSCAIPRISCNPAPGELCARLISPVFPNSWFQSAQILYPYNSFHNIKMISIIRYQKFNSMPVHDRTYQCVKNLASDATWKFPINSSALIFDRFRPAWMLPFNSLIDLIGFLKKILISPFLSYHMTCIPSSTEYVFRISFGIVVLNPNAISVFVILVPGEPLNLTLLISIIYLFWCII